MKNKWLILIFSLSIFSSHAYSASCNFTDKGLSKEFLSQLNKTCDVFKKYCHAHAQEQNCFDRLNHPISTRTNSENNKIHALSTYKVLLAEEIFSSVSPNKKEVSEKDKLDYELKLSFLDKLSRSPDPIMQDLILFLYPYLQESWKNSYYQSWSTWYSTNDKLFARAGIPLSYIFGQLAINNSLQGLSYSKYINASFPARLFAFSSSLMKIATPALTIQAVNELNPPPLMMPVSPAHIILFDYKHIDFSIADLEAFQQHMQREQSKEQISTGASLTAWFLVEDLHPNKIKVFPKWLPQWAQKILNKGSYTSAPTEKINFKTKLKHMFKLKNLFRVTPASIATSVAVDVGARTALNKYSLSELKERLNNKIITLPENSEEHLKNIRELFTLLAELDLFFMHEARNEFHAVNSFLYKSQKAIEEKVPLHLFFDDYFLNDKEEIIMAGAIGLKIRSCSALRGHGDKRVELRQLKNIIEAYKDKKQIYLSGLWTMIELLSSELKSLKLNQNQDAKEIIAAKIQQLQQEYQYIKSSQAPVHFEKWTQTLFTQWLKPLIHHFQVKKYSETYGRPSPVASPINSTTLQEYESLGYCL